MLNRIRQTTAGYPRQFWLLFWGQLMNSIGGSMVWPFLTIYVRERLGVPLTTVTLLITLNAASGLAATTIAGSLVDRFGRKLAMVLSLAMTSAAFILMNTASTLPVWMALMVLMGMFSPLYQVGSNAMIADLIAPERRAGGYALLRMIANVGVAIGPVIGGVLVTISYGLTFSLAAAAGTAFALLIALFVAETLPQRAKLAGQRQISGYSPVLRDRLFLAFCGIYTLSCMVYSLIMVLLPVYGKENFGLAESQYGPILATNATMVVLFQFAVTRMTERYHPVPVLALGTLFYALGVGSVALGWNFPTFLLSMVILTIGEMIVIPTSTAFTANLAPVEMRGRYMGVLGLTWQVGFGIGPVLGGFLNDRVAPVAIWYGGLVIGLVAALGFVLLAWRLRSLGRLVRLPSDRMVVTEVEGELALVGAGIEPNGEDD